MKTLQEALVTAGLAKEIKPARRPQRVIQVDPTKSVETTTESRPVETTLLTPKQIENWRRVLCGTIGPYALMMPDAEVQRLRNSMQRRINDDNN
jgi:hypothetical protein